MGLMVPTETLSRRDFLLPFAHKKGTHPVKPKQHGAGAHPPHSEPPVWSKFGLTRHQFIVGGAMVAGSIAIGLKPWELFFRNTAVTKTPEKPYTTPELVKLGWELQAWRLQDGRMMTDLFTEVLLTADLLKGNLDPRTILPQFKAPITFSTDINIGAVELTEYIDSADPRKSGIYQQGELLYYSNWLAKNTSVKLKLSPDILSSEARLYIIVKEASQLIYRLQYQRLYIGLLRRGSTTRLEIANPTKIPISEDEQIANIGMLISSFERARYGYSSLDDFIDVGSRLQTTPIGATQRLDMEKRGQSFGNPHWSQVEQTDTDFLESRGLLKKEDGVISWTKPFVIDEDFFKLFTEYVKPLGQPALIRPEN